MNKNLETKLVKKINELYITTRKKYLQMDNQGRYMTIKRQLTDTQIRQHLQFKHTIGVFSGEHVAKFLCFDLDFEDHNNLNWIYYLLINSLIELGIEREYIQVASSGNKGRHVLIFIEDGTTVSNIKRLFDASMTLIMDNIDDSVNAQLSTETEHVLQLPFGQIELRSTFGQGVKLELGINFKNNDNHTNKCLFMDKDNLNLIHDEDYLLSIKQIPKSKFTNLIDKITEEKEVAIVTKVKDEKLLIETTLKEPHSHKINRDENETISHIIDLIENGLQSRGTRHNSIFKISRYFRYMGMDENESLNELKIWMSKQNQNNYSMSLDDAMLECERVNRLVYEKGYTITGKIDNIQIKKSEILEVMKVKDKNAKIILYALLIHSKRYASSISGVFYLSFKQIKEMTGLGIDAGLSNIKKLEELGLIEVVERNAYRDKTYMKKPNKYKILFNSKINETSQDDVVVEILNTNEKLDYKSLYYDNVIKLFDNNELKSIGLSKHQYYELVNYKKNVS